MSETAGQRLSVVATGCTCGNLAPIQAIAGRSVRVPQTPHITGTCTRPSPLSYLMTRLRPALNSPAPGWKFDLPGPNQPVQQTPGLTATRNPPNTVDGVFLELSRSTLRVRGLGIWMGVLLFLVTSFFIVLYIYMMIAGRFIFPFGLNLVAFIAAGVSLWGGVYLVRMDTECPRDEPIRFNRNRRKVYIYRFHHDGLRPFSRKAWGVRPAVYDWEDLHAEACSVYGAMGTGGSIQTVTLAVLKPGTKEVLDRFIFAHDIDHGEEYWSMAQLFMQQGPQALPTFSHSPRDWNNEDTRFNLARRFAPKVQWPADMDLESRTAP